MSERAAQIATVAADGRALHLVKTGTHVNDSGPAVRQIADRLGIDASQCVVVLDDLNLEAGVVRRRERGSSGGHNGLQSILLAFQSEQVRRVKIGVGRPADGDVAAHVVRHFDVALAGVMSVGCDKACQALMDMVGVTCPAIFGPAEA